MAGSPSDNRAPVVTLPGEPIASGAGGANPSLDATIQLFSVLGAIWQNPFRLPPVTGLSIKRRPRVARIWCSSRTQPSDKVVLSMAMAVWDAC